MNTISLRACFILSAFCLVMACKKETSVENGGFNGTATGELVDSLGLCKAAEVKGTYQVDTPLVASSNYVSIKVNFTSQGKYKIYSDTVNGMWFIDSGFTVSTGAAVIKLKGYGTPILPKTSDFALIFNNTLCTFSVTTGGTGGTSGGTGGTGTGTNGDYFPTTSGSSFIYTYNPKIGTIDTFSVKVAEGLIPYNGFNYARFGTSLKDTFYFAKDGAGTYYALSTVDFDYLVLFDTIPTTFINYPFLKESANVGETWSTSDYGPVWTNGKKGVAKAIFTVISKNTVTHTVGNKTYSNVIDIKRDIMFKEDGQTTYSLFFSGDSFYAKNYGLIDQVLTTVPQKISLYDVPIIK